MKEPWEWEEADILALISNGVQESLTLEYKRCESLQKTDGRKKEISKDVSALANSAGGVIVYGVEEDKHLPTGIDVGYDPNILTKEWIEQVINSTIERRLDGVRIKEVALSGPHNAGKVLYVIHIPQSRRAPHMANDNRYYKRFNFESVPMEEYEVRDVAKRFETPDLFIGFRLMNGPDLSDPAISIDLSKPMKIELFVGNRSSAPADYALLCWSVDARLSNKSQTADNEIRVEHQSIPTNTTMLEWRGALRLPIWESVRYQLTELEVSLPATGSTYIFWEAQAPLMPRRMGKIKLTTIGGVLHSHSDELEWHYERPIYRRV